MPKAKDRSLDIWLGMDEFIPLNHTPAYKNAHVKYASMQHFGDKWIDL